MPELPEVETVRRELETKILDRTIQAVEIRNPVVLRHSTLDLESIAFENQFSQIKRIGKLLQFFFAEDDKVMLAHLKMTGQFLFVEQGEVSAGIFPLLYASTSGGKKTAGQFREDQLKKLRKTPSSNGKFSNNAQYTNTDFFDKHTHVVFHFKDGSQLAYRDVRKFGYLTTIPQSQLEQVTEKYGPDPLHDSYTLENFTKAFQGKKKSVKAILMDQQLIAGLGNIYADEICHQAGLRPTKKAPRLRKTDIKAMYEASQIILQKALNSGGTTLKDFARSDGSSGSYAFELQVYGRTGEQCLRCSQGQIKKIVHIQRGTHYCPKCQR